MFELFFFLFPVPVEHPCSVNNGGCEHICIPFYKLGVPMAKCKCQVGFKLQPQGRKCAGKI